MLSNFLASEPQPGTRIIRWRQGLPSLAVAPHLPLGHHQPSPASAASREVRVAGCESRAAICKGWASHSPSLHMKLHFSTIPKNIPEPSSENPVVWIWKPKWKQMRCIPSCFLTSSPFSLHSFQIGERMAKEWPKMKKNKARKHFSLVYFFFPCLRD